MVVLVGPNQGSGGICPDDTWDDLFPDENLWDVQSADQWDRQWVGQGNSSEEDPYTPTYSKILTLQQHKVNLSDEKLNFLHPQDTVMQKSCSFLPDATKRVGYWSGSKGLSSNITFIWTFQSIRLLNAKLRILKKKKLIEQIRSALELVLQTGSNFSWYNWKICAFARINVRNLSQADILQGYNS